MTVNLPPKVRLALYIVTGLGTPLMGYLLAREIIGELEVALWTAEIGFVSLLAAFNVDVQE